MRRPVHGILLLDKPAGLTSNAALQKVKACYQAQKAGHTGSLDPLATGLLPICLGEATKVSSYLLAADKRYHVTLRLGITTDTADAEGVVLHQQAIPPLATGQIEGILSRFQGPQLQVPPMYSALKQQGQPLYKLARQGKTVERAARAVEIQEIRLLNWQAPDLTLTVACSKGTYIRVLATDIGAALGCGAHVTVLRRTGLAAYPAEPWVSLSQVADLDGDWPALDALLWPLDSALAHLSPLTVSDSTAKALAQGQQVAGFAGMTGDLIRIYQDNRFLGIGEMMADGVIKPHRWMNLAVSP